jgi:ubiquinone/menaquinone biosynthesis C-methylase UbiE
MNVPHTKSPAALETGHYTDRKRLTTLAYGDSANLAIRQGIDRYRHPQLDFIAWTLDSVEWQNVESVLDIGCGNGIWLRWMASRIRPHVRLIGMDLSRGMVNDLVRTWKADHQLSSAVADVQALPLRTASCDLVLVMNMFYHVPEIVGAIHDVRRVLRRGGMLLAVTAGESDKQELHALYNSVVAKLANRSIAPYRKPSSRFSLENGMALLRQAFATVDRRDLAGKIIFPDIAPVIDFIASTRSLREPELPQGVRWETVMCELEQQLRDYMATYHTFEVSTLAGVFVCS